MMGKNVGNAPGNVTSDQDLSYDVDYGRGQTLNTGASNIENTDNISQSASGQMSSS